ncbi:hypothetical protein JDV02_006819 [Purpureocillium takamizusanense]|uniref:Thiol methyltransferase n=1 Tax=Purpureocillium takamizusanense TaxID=2060973 RepID=A0A9Q8QJG2_9HYPO|nr:uncharacterized protein JDV02_006819 [Purpureocillium takamizusanense]UNI20760.1 hypothetical protein JDV02_006819 [Purpureocillium takamizusanense]
MNAPITSPMGSRTVSTAPLSSSQQSSPTNAMAQPAAPQPPAQAQPGLPTSPSTDAFLKDFTLVAEAAKRAQVAVMVRDFESCGL